MRFFIVTVYPQRTEVQEQTKPLRTVHARAWVDGTACLYQVKKGIDNDQNRRAWLGRGLQETHYHAHNAGATVRFEPVLPNARKKRKINENKLSIFT